MEEAAHEPPADVKRDAPVAAEAVVIEASEVVCSDPRPRASVCRCLAAHVETWGENVTARCTTERRLGDAWLARVETTDRHAGTQYFVVHDGPAGSSVIGLLAHHTPGGGGIYRDFRIDAATVRAIGPGKVLRIDTTVVEKEFPVESAGQVREVSRTQDATVCVLAAPGRSRAFCMMALPTLDRGSDGNQVETWERVHEVRVGEDGALAYVPVGGSGAGGTRRLW